MNKKKLNNTLPITDPNMTRFNISLIDGVRLVFYALEKSIGGELFVPKIPSYKILDVANAIGPDCEKPIVGVRPGEKIHEEMITSSDSFNTYDIGKYYVILPEDKKIKEKFEEKNNFTKVPLNFSYNSRDNKEWETVETLKEKIKSLNLT